MVILNKKRIVFFISVLMVAFISVSLTNDKSELETVQTSSVPVSGYTIILDAGHRSARWWSCK